MYTHYSFGLIEFFLILAIVGITMVIGVNVYKQYLIHSSINQIVDKFNTLADQSEQFANQHKRFASAAELGLSPDQSFPEQGAFDVDDDVGAQVIPFYLPQSQGYVVIYDASPGFGNLASSCGKRGVIAGTFDTTKMALPKHITYLYVEYNLWHDSGTIYRNCTYEYGNDRTSYTGDLIPECININVSAHYDAANWKASNNYIDNYSTCMF